MGKFLYVAEFHELGKPELSIPLGYFKSFKEAKEVTARLDTDKYAWTITERKYGKIDVMEDYRVAWSYDVMAGDILVKAGELFPAHGAKITCRIQNKAVSYVKMRPS